MKFCIPVRGARIVLLNDLTIFIKPYSHNEFMRYKACAKESHDSTFYNGSKTIQRPGSIHPWDTTYEELPRGAPFKYYTMEEQSFTIPKGTVLKIGSTTFDYRVRNQPRILINFSIFDTSLEEENFPIYTSKDEWAPGVRRKKALKSPSFYLESASFNDLEFDFAV